MIRLLLVDDEVAIRRGLRMQLELEADVAVVGEAGDGETALALAPELHPDVVVMDIRMRGMDGIEATEAMAHVSPGIPVVMLSLHDDPATRARAKAAGARGFVGKHEAANRLLATIREVAAAAI
jgi:DNA-binding NarL/FixJ family response regulator